MWEWWSGKDNLPTGISPSSVSLFHTVSLSGGKMQTSHTMNALLSPHRMPIHQPDITYRTRFAAYSARDTAFIYMETPCTNDKRTNKGFTTYVSARQHCPHAHSRPSSVQWHLRQSKRQHAVRSLSSWGKAPHRPNWTSVHRYWALQQTRLHPTENVPPGGSFPFPYRPRMYTRHNGNSSPATGAATKINQDTRCIPWVYRKTIPSLSAIDSPAGIEPCLRQSTMLTAVSCIASASNSAIQREFPVAVNKVSSAICLPTKVVIWLEFLLFQQLFYGIISQNAFVECTNELPI